MVISELIRSRYENFLTLCRNHKVKKLYAFGSSVSGQFNPEKSDIDLIVEIDENDPIEKGDILLHFFSELEKLFNRKVDLLTDQPIENPYLKTSVEKSKVLIYAGEANLFIGSHDEIIGFFNEVFHLMARSNGITDSQSWKKAKRGSLPMKRCG